MGPLGLTEPGEEATVRHVAAVARGPERVESEAQCRPCGEDVVGRAPVPLLDQRAARRDPHVRSPAPRTNEKRSSSSQVRLRRRSPTNPSHSRCPRGANQRVTQTDARGPGLALDVRGLERILHHVAVAAAIAGEHRRAPGQERAPRSRPPGRRDPRRTRRAGRACRQSRADSDRPRRPDRARCRSPADCRWRPLRSDRTASAPRPRARARPRRARRPDAARRARPQ